jgi:hypothetical protein
MKQIILGEKSVKLIIEKKMKQVRVPLVCLKHLANKSIFKEAGKKDLLFSGFSGKTPVTANFFNIIDKKTFAVKIPYEDGDDLWIREPVLINSYNTIKSEICFTYKVDKLQSTCEVPLDKYRDKKRLLSFPNNCVIEMKRIFLSVVLLNVERIQDISSEDLTKSGFTEINDFKKVWNFENKDSYKWEDNPFVVVLKIKTFTQTQGCREEEKIKFKCKKCGKITENTMTSIIAREKKCYDCYIEENDLLLKKKEAEKKLKIKRKEALLKTVICEYCNAPFKTSSSAKYCSSECRGNGLKTKREKTRFYNNLDRVNKEINITKIRVYGQGRYEHINFFKDIKK